MLLSFVMQAYIDPEDEAAPNRFKRAIDSFIAQYNPNSELIIVADGCQQAKRIYNQYYANYANIKFIYLEEATPRMYTRDGSNNLLYYRGYPRQVGVDAAQGEVITYLDADDWILPSATDILLARWASFYSAIGSNFNRLIQTGLLLHQAFITPYDPKFETMPHFDHKLIDTGHQSVNFTRLTPQTGFYQTWKAPWMISHTNNLNIRWADVWGNPEIISEDKLFFNEMIEYDKPIYYYFFNQGYYVYSKGLDGVRY